MLYFTCAGSFNLTNSQRTRRVGARKCHVYRAVTSSFGRRRLLEGFRPTKPSAGGLRQNSSSRFVLTSVERQRPDRLPTLGHASLHKLRA